MANFESNTNPIGWYAFRVLLFCEFRSSGKEVKIVHKEVLFIGRFGIVSVANVENILRNVFLNNEPGSAAKAETFALSNGMEPQTLVFSYLLSGFKLNNVARLFTEITSYILVIINVSEEANAL